MEYYGYAGGILHVNLTDDTFRKEPLDLDLVKLFIGGMGMGGALAYKYIKPGIDPLSPENVLIQDTGVFSGTLVPGCPRCDYAGKSPLTGLLALSGSGNSIGPMLKYAGYDYLVITGRAEKPVYLVITDDDVEVRDARAQWGKGIYEATDAIRKEVGDYWVSCIGPAGENLIRFANIIDNKFGMNSRVGLGAIMGSKNLKAIAIRGTKGIKVNDRKTLLEITDSLRERVTKPPISRIVEMWRMYGEIIDFYMGGIAPPGFTQKEYADRVWHGYVSCLGCPVGDKGIVGFDDGKYVGLRFKLGNPFQSTFAISGITNWDENHKCMELANRYGMDAFDTSRLIDLAISLYEQGIITKEDTDGLELKRDAETTFLLMEKIARRQGIGDVLAEGSKIAIERIGKNAYKYAYHVKGLSTLYDLREFVACESFGILTNPKGAHQERGYSVTFAPRKDETLRRYCRQIGVPDGSIEKVLGLPAVGSLGPLDKNYNVARLLKWVEDYNSAIYSLGGCDRTPAQQLYTLDNLTKLYLAVTGIEMSRDELREAGERIWNLHRLFNAREGATRKDDMPPYPMMHEPLVKSNFSGVTTGEGLPPVKEESVQQLLDEYYEERGWNIATGNPTKKKLEALGLEDLMQDL